MSAKDDAVLSGIRDVVAATSPAVTLDATDLALVEALLADGRASQRQLSAQLGISAPTVAERMSRLERGGVITGYVAQVDWGALGFGQLLYLSVTAEPGADISEIMQRMWEVPEVEELIVVTGELDLLVRMRVRDHEHLRQVLMNEVWQIRGIQRTSTMLSLGQMPRKDFGAGLIEHRCPTS